tara:strand:+ start:1263 stop:1658 length:396 start_codon:yes stop_codon:yes gene_type:complete
MQEFNITRWFKNQYLAEANINEDFNYGDLAKSHTAELIKISKNNNPSVRMNTYDDGDREDSDPLKGRGHGSISFGVSNELSSDDWGVALDWVKSKGYEITSDNNYYEKEYDNDRIYTPKIKFEFDTEDIKL